MGINRHVKILDLRISAMICGMMLLGLPAFAGGTEDIRVLKISPQDGRAVIRSAEGEMRIIKAGDMVPVASSELRVGGEKKQKSVAGHVMRVVEIAEGRVVLEEKKGDETETVIIRLLDGKQRVERVRKTGEKRPELLAPQVTREPKGVEVSPIKRKNPGDRFN